MRAAARTRARVGVHALRGHLNQPLEKTGYALTTAGMLTSVLGLVYWIVAARLYDEDVVGAGSAVISALLLVSGSAQLSMNAGLVRFLPAAGVFGGRLVAMAYLATSGVALVLGYAATVVVPALTSGLDFLDAPAWSLSFAGACAVWSVFSLQDGALTGLRRAGLVLMENTAYSLAKIVLLIVLASAGAVSGILASWVVPAAIALVPINLLLFARFLPRHRTEPAGAAPAPVSRALIAQFVVGNHLATLLNLGALTALPIVVASMEGTASNAYFFAAWSIATALQLLPQALASSLTGEAARDVGSLARHTRSVLRQVLPLFGTGDTGHGCARPIRTAVVRGPLCRRGDDAPAALGRCGHSRCAGDGGRGRRTCHRSPPPGGDALGNTGTGGFRSRCGPS